MNAESNPRRGMPWLFKIVFVLGALLLLLVFVLAVWRWTSATGNAKRFAAIRAAGEPATARELDAWYGAVEEKENAALLWIEAMSRCNPPLVSGQPVPWSQIKLPPPGQRLTATQLRQATEILEANREALALFRQAAARMKSRYPVDLSQAMFVDLPHLSALKSAVNLLQLEALVHAQNGRGAEAVASLETMLAAGRSLAQEPILISQLVRAALDYLSVSALERTLHLATLNEAQLASLQFALAAAESPNLTTRAFIGERACTATVLNSPEDLTPPSNPQALQNSVATQRGFGSSLMRASGFFQRDLGFFLDAMSNSVALSRAPDPGPFLAGTNMDAVVLQARRGYYIMSALTLPAFGKVSARDASHRARLRAAQAAVAVERHRLAHGGRLPASLDALAPKYFPVPPVDPFTGEALHFQVRPQGYVIYSVGEDGADDDGTPLPSGSPAGKPPHDLPFVMQK